jgi:hypothetical protein
VSVLGKLPPSLRRRCVSPMDEESFEFMQRCLALSPEVMDVLIRMAPAARVYLERDSVEDGFCAFRLYFADPKDFYVTAAKHAMASGDIPLMLAIYDTLCITAKHLIRGLVKGMYRHTLPGTGGVPKDEILIAGQTFDFVTTGDDYLRNTYISVVDPDELLPDIYELLSDSAAHKVRLLIDHDERPEPEAQQEVTKLYMQNQNEFEAKYENTRAYVKMVGLMKQTCKDWGSICKGWGHKAWGHNDMIVKLFE